MDTSQLLLTVTLSVTTLFLIVIGIQLMFVLRDVRKTVNKINAIIEGFEKLGSNVEHGFKEAVGFFAGTKAFFKVLELINKKKSGKNK